MSPVNTMRIVNALILAALVLIGPGCSNPNAASKASFNSEGAAGEQHAAGWLPDGHAKVARLDGNTCSECHGSDLGGGISGVSCSECHEKGSPFTFADCTSCHGNPPSGTEAPDRSGSHAVHNAVPAVANVCSTCHEGAGSGSTRHNNGSVNVNFRGVYDAKSGAGVLNADGTCSKVSCHGGLTTPAWTGGTIDVNTQCDACHSYGSGEYNSYGSGQHFLHVVIKGFPCSACHDTQQLAAGHFTTLDTSAVEGPASATIINDGSWNTYSNNYCFPVCHESKPWN